LTIVERIESWHDARGANVKIVAVCDECEFSADIHYLCELPPGIEKEDGERWQN